MQRLQRFLRELPVLWGLWVGAGPLPDRGNDGAQPIIPGFLHFISDPASCFALIRPAVEK